MATTGKGDALWGAVVLDGKRYGKFLICNTLWEQETLGFTLTTEEFYTYP